MTHMNVHWSGSLTFRAAALMSFQELILNCGVRELARNGEQSAPRLAFLIAEASVGVFFPPKMMVEPQQSHLAIRLGGFRRSLLQVLWPAK